MSDRNSNELRDRARRYQQIAQQMNDAQAVQALQEMAREFNNRADQIQSAPSEDGFISSGS
jgi:hypothetical protein